jgi:hypothetical protein
MTKLKLMRLVEDKPVKLSIELPGAIHRDFQPYAEALAKQSGQAQNSLSLIAPMLARFIATDRAFTRRKGER